MVFYSEEIRWLAYTAWRLARGDIRKACKVFHTLEPPETPSHLGEFIKYWGEYIKAHGHPSNTPGKGSKTEVPSRLVQAALARFVQGYYTELGQVRNYPTFLTAVAFDPIIRAILESSGVTPATFFAHMRQVSSALLPWQCCTQQSVHLQPTNWGV